MNVIMITPDFPYSFGGIGEHVSNLVGELQNHNDLQLHVMITRFANSKMGIQNVEFAENKNVFLYEIGNLNHQKKFMAMEKQGFAFEYEALKTCLYSLEIFERIDSIIEDKKIKVDLIHIHDAFGAIAALALKKKYDVPLITTMHSIGNEDYLIDGLRKYLIRNSSEVIYVSDYLRNQLSRRYNWTGEKEHIIPNGIKLEKREKKEIPNQFLFVGRLERKKGVDILLKAAHELRELGLLHFNIDICGEGTEKKQLEQDILKMGLQEQVKLWGYQSKEELNEKYKKASLVIIPSREESFGLVAIEAMAKGTSVLCSNIANFREVVGEEAGFFFDFENEKDLAQQILFIMNHPEEKQKKIEKAYERIQDKYSWNIIAGETLKVYQEVARKKYETRT